MARPKKGLSKQEIAVLFDGDFYPEDNDMAELFSSEEITEANQDPEVGDAGDLDLPP